jgi:hypothetical protein
LVGSLRRISAGGLTADCLSHWSGEHVCDGVHRMVCDEKITSQKGTPHQAELVRAKVHELGRRRVLMGLILQSTFTICNPLCFRTFPQSSADLPIVERHGGMIERVWPRQKRFRAGMMEAAFLGRGRKTQ